jgi:DNA helicase TIP49 (TBP-interacting protein)
LLEEVDKDPWGRAYRIVTRKMGARTMLTAQDISHAVAKLFPPRRETQTDATRRGTSDVWGSTGPNPGPHPVEHLLQRGLGVGAAGGMPNMAFANDIAVLSMRCREELVALTNEALNIVARWIEGASLRLAVQKTEGILLLGNRRMREVKFEVAGVEVKAQELH